jgi:hypothetical protein
MEPGAHWPDGSPVSSWSQAIAALARDGSLFYRGDALRGKRHGEADARGR